MFQDVHVAAPGVAEVVPTASVVAAVRGPVPDSSCPLKNTLATLAVVGLVAVITTAALEAVWINPANRTAVGAEAHPLGKA